MAQVLSPQISDARHMRQEWHSLWSSDSLANASNEGKKKKSSGASGGSLHGGARFGVDKAHCDAWGENGPENSKNEVKLTDSLNRSAPRRRIRNR